MNPADLLALLVRLDACSPAQEWVSAAPGTSASHLWATCPRGDWLLWLSARAGVDRRLVVETACDCAETALPYAGETRQACEATLATVRRWARGEATREDVESVRAASRAASRAAASRAAASRAAAVYAASAAAAYADAAAYAADDDASDVAAVYAARAAAYVARAAADASYAADAAAYAAAYDASDAAAYAAARRASIARSADLVRARIPWASVAAALEVSRG